MRGSHPRQEAPQPGDVTIATLDVAGIDEGTTDPTAALDPGRPLETHLRWFVPATTKITTPTGPQPLQDDRLISAALIAEADKLLRDGRLLLGRAESIISATYDPLNEPPSEYYDPLENLPDW